MSDGDGESSDRTAPGTEDDEGVKVSIPDDFSDSTASPDRDFTPPSVRSGSGSGDGEMGMMEDRSSSEPEDVGKEEMFVDAPDQYLEDSVVIVGDQADGQDVRRLSHELATVRSQLHNALADKDLVFREFGEFKEELRLLHSQLQSMSNQRNLMGESGEKMVDRLIREEGAAETGVAAAPRPLRVVVSDCNKFVLQLKSVLDEQLQSESAMRELHAVLCAKDLEVDELFTKVTELSISGDILASHLVVVQKECVSVQEELSEHRKRENDLIGEFKRVEEENRKLTEQLGRANESVTDANMQLNQTKVELEQTESRLATSREKLSMAVTKGKALVQQRDSLRQTVNEKTSEIEKCLQELKLKSDALESAEAKVEDLMKSQDTLVSLQESLWEKEKIFHEMEDVLSHVNVPVQVQSLEILDRFRWLVDVNNQLELRILRDQKVEDVVSSIDMPEAIRSSDLEAQISWLVQSNNQAREDVSNLVDKVADMQVSVATNSSDLSSAHLEIKRLGELLSHEQEDKDVLQAQLDEITERFEELSKKFSQASLHRDIFIRALDEISGIRIDDLISNDSLAEIEKFSEGCIHEIKEKSILLEESKGKIEELAHQVSFLKDQLNRMFLEASKGFLDNSETHDANFDDLSTLSTKCFQNIRKGKAEFEKLAEKCEQLEEKIFQISSEKDRTLEKLYDFMENIMDDEDGQPPADLGVLFAKCIGKIKENNGILEDVKARYECLLSQMSSEKKELVKKLLELSGTSLDGYAVGDSAVADDLVEECIGKIHKIIKAPNVPSSSECEQSQTLQSLLYVKFQEAMLYEWLLVEELNDRSGMEKLYTELSHKDEVVTSLKNEKDLLLNDLRRAEDKTSLLRDKLSLAVKKGKGMVQEREGLKLNIDQKTAEIEGLKSDLKQQQSLVMEFKDQIASMSDDLQKISNLQREIKIAKEEKDHMEKLLLERSNMLQTAVDLIENISVPTHFVFTDPIQKLKQIGEYLQELQNAHTQIKEEAEIAEKELHVLTQKLEDCYITIRSVKDAFAQAEGKISALNEERDELKVNKTSTEQELENVKAKGALLAGRLADAQRTISSLEEALSLAENTISIMEDEKREIQSQSQQEIVSLNTRCAGYMEELSGSHGTTENQFSQLVDQLNHLDVLMRNENPIFRVSEGIRRNIEGLRRLAPLLQDLQSELGEQGLDIRGLEVEDIPAVSISVSQLEDDCSSSQASTEGSADHVSEGISSYISKYTEKLRMQNKLVNDNSASLCLYMDRQIAVLFKALGAIKDQIAHTVSTSDSLKLEVQKLEAYTKDNEDTISKLDSDISVLLSSCRNAEQDLQVALSNCTLNLDDEVYNEDLNPRPVDVGRTSSEDLSYVEAGRKLLAAVKLVRAQFNQLEYVKENWVNLTNELQNELHRTKSDAENSLQDKALHLNKISEMGKEIDSLQHYSSKLKLELENCNLVEEKLREKEGELSSVLQILAAKEQEMSKHGLSRDNIEALFSKVNDIYVFQVSKIRSLEGQVPADVDKLFYIVDNFREIQQLLDSVSEDKEKLQIELAARVSEIDSLKEDAERLYANNEDLEKDKNVSTELNDGLKILIEKLGGNWPFDDRSITSASEFLHLLEKLIVELISDSETTKKNYQELSLEFQKRKKIADGLSEKVKLLESLLNKQVYAEPVQERSIYEAPSLGSSSEILEIEDGGLRGKNQSISPVPAAPVVRTLRKGSSEHLALNIADLESEHLIDHPEADHDKGHVFQSLNSSGLIPKQAKSVADRVDSLWVSGGRLLMRRPEARLTLIAYWLLLHFWVLGTIL